MKEEVCLSDKCHIFLIVMWPHLMSVQFDVSMVTFDNVILVFHDCLSVCVDNILYTVVNIKLKGLYFLLH